MRLLILAIVAAAAVPAAGEAVSWNAGVSYQYDAAGNIWKIGEDLHVYDVVGRLVRSKTNGVWREYSYDAFGNRTTCTHAPGTANQSDCQAGVSVISSTNRLTGLSYDSSGNVTQANGRTYTYDPGDMIARSDSAGGAVEYVYTADDERIAVYTVPTGAWQWTVRNLDHKPLREFTSQNGTTVGATNWQWIRDYIWREGLLLATRHADGSTFHYHLDHLGTPRRITDDTDYIAGYHDYMAFGPEVPDGRNETPLTRTKYTGHERDVDTVSPIDSLDYMHARYYSPNLGRFLSVDPVWDYEAAMLNPQMWNRYSYALNNPLKFVDPTGEIVSLANLSDDERDELLRSLNSVTGNEYGVNDDGELTVLNYGQNASGLATWFLDQAIGSTNTYAAHIQNDSPVNLMNAVGHDINIDFADFRNMNTMGLSPEAMGLGSNFIHELAHTHFGWRDPYDVGAGPPAGDKQRITGGVVDFVNAIHRERGLPLRGPTYEPTDGQFDWRGRYRVPFIDPQTRRVVHVRVRLRN